MRKKWQIFSIALAVIMVGFISPGCSKKSETPETQPPESTSIVEETAEASETETTAVREAVAPGKIHTEFSTEFQISGEAYQPLAVTADAPQYGLNTDLSNLENLDQFSNLTQEQRGLIAQNGFVVVPTDAEQLFYIYEDNTYKKVPSFVTADSVLQLYHIYYDYALRNLESKYFYQNLMQLNENMIAQLTAEYEYAEDEDVKDGILQATAYFSVVNLAFGKETPDILPQELREKVRKEYELIVQAKERGDSPLFGNDIDYSLFKVRGHYTRSEELGKYFRAMSWYGIMPFQLYDEAGAPKEEEAVKSILITIALCRLPEENGIKLWENIYSPTTFFVGESDDITPYEIAKIVEKVYSGEPAVDEIPDKLDEFFAEAKQLREAQIVSKNPTDTTAVQMRFMGQRYIPDSEILQGLTDSEDRPIPCGMDVFAVFGSERAEELLDEIYKPAQLWSGYQKAFDLLKNKFQSQTIEEQTNNLYNGWLYCLKSLTERTTDGVPFFMQNHAWEDKSLSTALGSWAEIRHDTILYGKQSASECGGGMEPPELVGYVEPNPEFFNRLLWLTTATRENLGERGLLDRDLEDKSKGIEDMLLFLKNCAEKELRGEDLNAEEQYSLLTYGGTLEWLSSSIAEAAGWYSIESDTDRNMALIADVHTANSVYLEAAVGTAAEIYVAIPQNGKVFLTRGAVFDYFEFTTDVRMTDEEWQKAIKQQQIPDRPPFTGSYMDEVSAGAVPVPEEPYSTGC